MVLLVYHNTMPDMVLAVMCMINLLRLAGAKHGSCDNVEHYPSTLCRAFMVLEISKNINDLSLYEVLFSLKVGSRRHFLRLL